MHRHGVDMDYIHIILSFTLSPILLSSENYKYEYVNSLYPTVMIWFVLLVVEKGKGVKKPFIFYFYFLNTAKDAVVLPAIFFGRSDWLRRTGLLRFLVSGCAGLNFQNRCCFIKDGKIPNTSIPPQIYSV